MLLNRITSKAVDLNIVYIQSNLYYLNLNLNFIDNNIYIITKLLAPATSKMTNRGGGKGYTLTTREKLNTTN